MWRDDATLVDIATFARDATEFVRGVDFARFMEDAEKRWAVVAQILLIGEAVSRLTEEFKDDHPDIEWGEIVGMRNRLIHGYEKIRWNMVWDAIQQDVPALLAYITPLIPPPPPDGPTR